MRQREAMAILEDRARRAQVLRSHEPQRHPLDSLQASDLSELRWIIAEVIDETPRLLLG